MVTNTWWGGSAHEYTHTHWKLLTLLAGEAAVTSSPVEFLSVVMGNRLYFTLGPFSFLSSSASLSGDRITVQIPCGGKISMFIVACYCSIAHKHRKSKD